MALPLVLSFFAPFGFAPPQDTGALSPAVFQRRHADGVYRYRVAVDEVMIGRALAGAAAFVIP